MHITVSHFHRVTERKSMLEENISKYRINSSYLWILDFFFVYFYFPNILQQTCGTLVTIKLSYISTSQVGNEEVEKWGQTDCFVRELA